MFDYICNTAVTAFWYFLCLMMLLLYAGVRKCMTCPRVMLQPGFGWYVPKKSLPEEQKYCRICLISFEARKWNNESGWR